MDNNHQAVILIADDEQFVRNVFVRALESSYHLLVAENGRHALEICAARNEPIDLAILDIVMPGMNGFELLGCLRDLFPGVRVIFMSGYNQQQALERAGLEFNAGRFLRKPFTAQQVRDMVAEELAADRKSKTA